MPRKKSSADTETSPVETPMKSPEDLIQSTLETARDNVSRCIHDVIAHTQQHPEEALLYALGAGYALRMLPTVRILSGVAGLALRLVKPAVLVYGASKLWHVVQTNGATTEAPRGL